MSKELTRILRNLMVAIKNLLVHFLRKYFVTNFTCSWSFRVNSTCKVHPITNKLFFGNYSNLPISWLLLWLCLIFNVSYKDVLYAELFLHFMICKWICWKWISYFLVDSTQLQLTKGKQIFKMLGFNLKFYEINQWQLITIFSTL